MSEMVERVARRLAYENGETPDLWTKHEGAARAAIAAMREPTEAMLDKGSLEIADEASDALTVFQAMIDEALK